LVAVEDETIIEYTKDDSGHYPIGYTFENLAPGQIIEDALTLNLVDHNN